MNNEEDWKTWPEPPTDTGVVSERVVAWQTGDPFDKLRDCAGKKGIEVRAEREGTVVVGPLKRYYAGTVVVGVMGVMGALTLTASRWSIAVTAPKPVAPWWQIEGIEPGHVVSWTDTTTGKPCGFVWWSNHLAAWRDHWDDNADPGSWRVTDVHAEGGPKLIAGGEFDARA